MNKKQTPFEKWYNSKSAAKFREEYGIGIHEVDCQAGWVACSKKALKVIEKHFANMDTQWFWEFMNDMEKQIVCKDEN